MNKALYPRLAINNIKKNYQTYVPFILTSICMVMMFYIVDSIASNPDILLLRGGEMLAQLLDMGIVIIGIFAIIFLLYTNGFLVKRRKKEFGLYSILGMEKKHISKILLYETLIVYLLSLVVGLLLGVLFDKLVFMLVVNMLGGIVPIGFQVSRISMFNATTLFSFIFLLILIRSVYSVYRNQTIELLKGGKVGEKEPNAKWILTIIGLGCLAYGYYIATTVTNPLAATTLFFVAVLLVIVGTYVLFTTGSIALLKIAKKNRNLYYKPKNFISISSMFYRMKQNAWGLASICILSTMVLVMLSTTASLYAGVEDSISKRYIRDIGVYLDTDTADVSYLEEFESEFQAYLKNKGIETTNHYSYTFLQFTGFLTGNELDTNITSFDDFSSVMDKFVIANFMTMEQYTKLTGDSVSINDNEVLMYTLGGKIQLNNIMLFGNEYKVVQKAQTFESNGLDSAIVYPKLYIVVKDATVFGDIFSKQVEINQSAYPTTIQLFYGFDMPNYENDDVIFEVIDDFIHDDLGYERAFLFESKATEADFAYGMYGGLFFLGISLGLVFIVGTTLIIYYKQITEGYEDRERFEIMQKVGMSLEEVKKSINSQVLQVFFLPLVVAIIHLAFAFNIISLFMGVLSFNNMSLFIYSTIITITVFTVFYVLVYSLTAKVYYKIVSR